MSEVTTIPIKDATLQVYKSRSILRGERWRWRLTAANGNILAGSSEGYANLDDAKEIATKICSGYYWRESR